MSNIKSLKDRLSQLIQNPTSIFSQKDGSFKSNKEHTQRRKEIQHVREEKETEDQSYWEIFRNAL